MAGARRRREVQSVSLNAYYAALPAATLTICIILSHANVHRCQEPRVQERSEFFAGFVGNCGHAGYPRDLDFLEEPPTITDGAPVTGNDAGICIQRLEFFSKFGEFSSS